LEGKNAVRAGFVEKKGTFDLNLRKWIKKLITWKWVLGKFYLRLTVWKEFLKRVYFIRCCILQDVLSSYFIVL
jgi:hypothetical protein